MQAELDAQQAFLLWRMVITGEEPTLSTCGVNPAARRRALVEAGHLAVEQRGRSRHLVLTDKAWRWAADHGEPPLPPRTSKAVPVFAELLRLVAAHLAATGTPLVELVRPDPPHTSGDAPGHAIQGGQPDGAIEEAITTAYLELTGGEYSRRVRLADLRPRLPRIDRPQLDTALRALQRRERAVLMQLDDPVRITPEDEDAVLRIGTDPRHLVYLRS